MQVAHLEIFEIDHVVLAHECERRLVVEVAPLAGKLLVLSLQEALCLATAFTAVFPASYPPLGFLEMRLRCAKVAWVLHDTPISSDEKHLEAHVDAGLFTG